MDDKHFYYDLVRFEIEMLAHRGNFFLLFNSFLIATATLGVQNGVIPAYLIFFLGILINIFWFYINFKQNIPYSNAMEKAKEHEPRLREVLVSCQVSIDG